VAGECVPVTRDSAPVDANGGAGVRGGKALDVGAVNHSFPLRSSGGSFGARRAASLRSQLVLENISLNIGAGELVSIIGPSGCGKTTLLRIVAGLLRPDAGEVRVYGELQNGPSPKIGMVFQDSRLLPWRTVRRNVEFAVELKHHRRLTAAEKSEVMYYLDAVGLTKFADSYPHELSGGMQSRVGVARAMARTPEIIIMDEPFSALDAQTRLLLQEFLLGLRARFGFTALLVTHDIDEAIYLSTRCIVLSRSPAQIRAIVDTRLPQTGDVHDTRSMPEFGELHRTLWDLLRDDAVEDEAFGPGDPEARLTLGQVASTSGARNG
jgi:NitT/TauT family transport system ATP-binding protein